ncbi:hypothetical protein FMUND_15268 [Fusarium mundagurra]|uniref:Uncharacterized protein n=1 Tax=Fusarium mundagurra TaxID=1567541 RepID=A0A8H6CZL2_9HYPO|nr:hypothetical protein FMUND_15268 [Fusarium mundagurra]
MQLLSTLVFIGVTSASAPRAAGRSSAFMALEGVMEGVTKRHTVLCSQVAPGPNLCERSCGSGYVECVDKCYNPGIGEVCCSDGSHCSRGYYCTNAGCCPDGESLEECRATATLSTIPPPAATKKPSGSTSHPQASAASTAPATVITPLPPVVTAGAGKNTEVGALAAIGDIAALLLAM